MSKDFDVKWGAQILRMKDLITREEIRARDVGTKFCN
jgi:hypothetical protein